MQSVSAHTNLGNLNGLSPYFRNNDHELNPTNSFAGQAHVPGPLAYVWPGSGLNRYANDPSQPPGYQAPFQDFGDPPQLAGNSYSPHGAILTSTSDHDNVGDLIIALNFSRPTVFATETNPNPRFMYRNITIYIPAPVTDQLGNLKQDGFDPAGGIDWANGETTNIITTLTDSYGNIFVKKADRYDPFAPGWWEIYIISSGTGLEWTPERQWREWYYIRINQMRAPLVAGRYFFKIFLGDHYPARSQTPASLINSTMPMENWPVLLVKGETDPAIITGTIRYGDLSNTALYGLPLNLPGVVRAVGVADNPYTGQSTGRPVEARGYLNATSKGHYEVEGLAPGVYDLYASAAGFPEIKVAENVKLYRGQSFHIDLYLKVGLQVRGEIFAKHLYGVSPWRGQYPVSVVIYDSNDYSEDHVVSFSPINLTHSPYASYVRGNTVFDLFGLNPPSFVVGGLLAPNMPKLVAFPWEGPIGYYGNTVWPSFKDPFGLYNGVGPAQSWWVSPAGTLDPVSGLGSTPTAFRFQFGAKGYYGAPKEFSGMVPQVFATWIDGLEPGRYFVRAFIHGYTQTTPDGTTFLDYYFTVAGEEAAGDADFPMDLFASSSIKLTVHFHDLPATQDVSPVLGPDPARFLIAEAFDSDGRVAALNFTRVLFSSSSATMQLTGLGMSGVLIAPDPRAGVKYSLFRYRGLRDYGLPADTYTIRVFMRGYIQALPPALTTQELDIGTDVSITTSTGISEISLHMYRGGGINVTVFSGDWQRPQVAGPWVWNGTSVAILVYDFGTRNFIDVIYHWNALLNLWNLPLQNFQSNVVPWPNWKIVFGSGASYLKTNGSTIVDRFGPDFPNRPSNFPEQDFPTNVFIQNIFGIGFLYNAFLYRGPQFRSTIAIYPGTYALTGWTYGYVQQGVYRLGDLGQVIVSVTMGSQADSTIRLIYGVNFTLSMVFKKEGIFSELPFNASMRIRIYDENDQLVAAASTSLDAGTLNPFGSSAGFFADGTKVYFAGGAKPPIPAGTRLVEYLALAGLFEYTELAAGTSESVRTATFFSADHGVWGSANLAGAYFGNWKIRVQVVNWYRPDEFYPPVPGLLQGESPWLFEYNHLGPFEMHQTIEIPNARLGGDASVIFELDQFGYVQGIVVGLAWSNSFRTVSWAQLAFTGTTATYVFYTWDGFYDGYLPTGQYGLRVVEWSSLNEGHTAVESSIFVSEGQSVNGLNFYLNRSETPIPELSLAQSMVSLALLSSAVFLLRRKHLEQILGEGALLRDETATQVEA